MFGTNEHEVGADDIVTELLKDKFCRNNKVMTAVRYRKTLL